MADKIATKRGICPCCSREYALTAAGVMRMHLGGEVGKLWRPDCEGVGCLPKATVQDPIAAARAAGYAEAVQALRDQADSWFDDTPQRTFWLNAAAYLDNRAGALAASAPSATTEEPTP